MPAPLDLTFWGVRGSIPTPVPENLGYGGNTVGSSLTNGPAGKCVGDVLTRPFNAQTEFTNTIAARECR